MDFSVSRSENRESDAFQEKCIKEYPGNRSKKQMPSSNMAGILQKKGKKTKKNIVCLPDKSNFAKKMKVESGAKNSTKQNAKSDKSHHLMTAISSAAQKKPFLHSPKKKFINQNPSLKSIDQKNNKEKPNKLKGIKFSKEKRTSNTIPYVNNDPKHSFIFHSSRQKMRNNQPPEPVEKEAPTQSLITHDETAFPRNYKKCIRKGSSSDSTTFRDKRKFSSNFSQRLHEQDTITSEDRSVLLKEKARSGLQAAKFRLLNEKLYTVTGNEAYQYFQKNSDAFAEYHLGYQQQVKKWPVNPVDIIINSLMQLPKDSVIADMGCGDAKIARTLRRTTVHSFDLVATNEYVTSCDMAKVPLSNESVDVAVFCLSLMGVNVSDYLSQAFRILKSSGLLKIAEVESRIDNLDEFIKGVQAYGFTLVNKDISNKMFVLLDFNKVKRKKKPRQSFIKLHPCLYKKR